ncbi:hypothetical protein PGTUg99_002982 [Puccinia graminis f. sp. tritici]|uniref:Uncharacterized protein n=1 Tax=Puccinia graminis f. sp. tritici TaxID=56615 RepID=A0A5B0QGT3_PUCGR|nr:hypothetical protein PGTUg99_002982 [Puccinia graminis f. sp. tritici]
MCPSSQHHPTSATAEEQQQQYTTRHPPTCSTESISFSNNLKVRDRSTQINNIQQNNNSDQSSANRLLEYNNDQWASPSPNAGSSNNIKLPLSASSFQNSFNHQSLHPERWPKKSRLVHTTRNQPSPASRHWCLIISLLTPFTCFAILLLIHPSSTIFQSQSHNHTIISSDRLTQPNPLPKHSASQLSLDPLKNLSSTYKTQSRPGDLSLNILLFSVPSLDPARSLDQILSFLDGLPKYSLVIVCSPAQQCPQPGNLSPHALIDSLSAYTPAMTADTILVLDGASLPYNGLDRTWLAAAAELALSRSRIIAPLGASPTPLPPAMACSSRPGPASVSLPPFLLPTRRWPHSDPAALKHISQPLQLAFFLATTLKWPTLIFPLDNHTPDHHYLSEICHDSIRQLSEIRIASHINPQQEEEDDDDVNQILRDHLQPSVGILMSESDLDPPAGSSSTDLTDWLALTCQLIERFDAEIYLMSSWDPLEGNSDAEGGEEEEERMRAQMKSCSRADSLIIHLLSHTSASTGLPHPSAHAQVQQLIHTQPSLELLFYRLPHHLPLQLPHRLSKKPVGPHQQPQDPDQSEELKNSQHGAQLECVLIGLPADHIFAADWILGLELQALKEWHKPKIDISVITNDRSVSLSRLLGSLERAAYYGDTVNLVINMEQTADQPTRKLVEGFEWKHGSKTVRKRIIQGGLLPAVVESWYPSSAHDSYGVLLEDDVEVSGYFYGWLKFALLEYRYSGRPAGAIYGISLYQPQHSELRPEGRRPFHAPALLAGLGVHPSTMPYASQVPCSWGALFFPETWTAFERYLTFRLANQLSGLQLHQPVIPSPIRSNRWPKSWKKYLIEWVYLRGLVMLYPNYHHINHSDHHHTEQSEWAEGEGLVPMGLSTNHLEIGTHVHHRQHRAKASHKLQYQQHQRAKLRFTRWEESIGVGWMVRGDDQQQEQQQRMIQAELTAAQVKREFAIPLKPLSRSHSLLDGLKSPPGSRLPARLPSLSSLTSFDLWAEPASLDILHHRGFFASLSSGICDPFEHLLRAHRAPPSTTVSSSSPPSDRLELLADICR